MKKLSTLIRWLARILGLFIVVMVILFAAGEGFTDPTRLTGDEQLMFAALLLMLLGALAAWKWEVVGALVIFAGFGLFWYAEGSMPGQYFSLFPVAACLHLIAWMLEHKPGAPSAPVSKTKAGRRARKRGRKTRA